MSSDESRAKPTALLGSGHWAVARLRVRVPRQNDHTPYSTIPRQNDLQRLRVAGQARPGQPLAVAANHFVSLD